MATTENPSTQKTVITDRSPQFLTGESNQFLFENNETIELEDAHPLFDIPIMETYDAFTDQLYQLNADKTYANDYDGLDILCFKAESAINVVLDINEFERKSIDHTTGVITEGTSFSSFTAFTISWFESFINHYNSLLYEETPKAFKTLRDAAIELRESSDLPNDLIVNTIASELELDIETT